MDLRQVFRDEDLAAIRAAAAEAERTSAGEVVPYIVGRSDTYPEAAWAGAAWGACIAALLATVLDLWMGPWGRYGPWWLALPPLAGAACGYVAAARVPALTRRLVADHMLAHRAQLRAEAAFLEESVFATRDRTGVLLLVSLFERHAVLLADEGARAIATPEEWSAIVARLTAELRGGNPTAAFVAAIQGCQALLQRLPPRADDVDELGDEVRVHGD